MNIDYMYICLYSNIKYMLKRINNQPPLLNLDKNYARNTVWNSLRCKY